jgi:hypothetical protein
MKSKLNQILKVSACVAVAACLAVGQARASVTLNLNVENLFSVDTLTVAPQNSLVVLLASTQNSSFGDLTLATSSFTVEADDIVIKKFALGAGGVFQSDAFLDIDTTTAPASGLSLGDPLLLVWFPNVTYSESLTGPGANQMFGTYRSDLATLASDIGWNVPANGTYALGAYAVSVGGDIADSAFVANLMTIPEPSSIALVALGCVGLLAVRRRKLVRA